MFVDYLHSYCKQIQGGSLGKAMNYALLGDAKRVRPMLVMLTNDALGGKQLSGGLRSALALELIHTYSLIHDDLPCMDDDDVRRGRIAVHKKFGEADALLAGNALLTDAFHLIVSDFKIWQNEDFLSPRKKIAIIAKLARAVGSRGMIRGQHLDLHANSRVSRDELREIHLHKTGYLIGAACAIGAIVSGQGKNVVSHLESIGQKTGLVFQILDDLNDGEQHGASALSLLSVAEAKALVAQLMTEIDTSLQHPVKGKQTIVDAASPASSTGCNGSSLRDSCLAAYIVALGSLKL